MKNKWIDIKLAKTKIPIIYLVDFITLSPFHQNTAFRFIQISVFLGWPHDVKLLSNRRRCATVLARRLLSLDKSGDVSAALRCYNRIDLDDGRDAMRRLEAYLSGDEKQDKIDFILTSSLQNTALARA